MRIPDGTPIQAEARLELGEKPDEIGAFENSEGVSCISKAHSIFRACRQYLGKIRRPGYLSRIMIEAT